MNSLQSFELIDENNDFIDTTTKTPLIDFYIIAPSGKILYIHKNKIFDIYKKYLSIDKRKYNSLLPPSLDIDKISFEKLALNLIAKDEIYDISNLYKLRDNIVQKSDEDESEIYINMPICTHGKISKKSFSKKLILTDIDNNELDISIDKFSIEKEKMFIEKNEIFILGTVVSLEKIISIDVGTILI
jgi:hypothetical protein